MSEQKREPLKVGDRVRVYGASTENGVLDGTVVESGFTVEPGFVWVRPDKLPLGVTDKMNRYQVKQLRRLKPAQRRRRVWIKRSHIDNPIAPAALAPEDDDDVEFVERPRKRGGR